MDGANVMSNSCRSSYLKYGFIGSAISGVGAIIGAYTGDQSGNEAGNNIKGAAAGAIVGLTVAGVCAGVMKDRISNSSYQNAPQEPMAPENTRQDDPRGIDLGIKAAAICIGSSLGAAFGGHFRYKIDRAFYPGEDAFLGGVLGYIAGQTTTSIGEFLGAAFRVCPSRYRSPS